LRRLTLPVLGLVLGVVVLGLRRLGDFDLPWHLALGRELFRHTLTGDTLSYTFPGRASPVEWLADGGLWLCFRAGGALGLQVLAATVAALLAVVVMATTRAPMMFRLAAASSALLIAAPWLVVRPALLGLLAATVVVYLIERHRTTHSLWPIMLAGLVQLAAAQVHGFCVLGAMVLVGWAIYAGLCRLTKGRFPSLLPAKDARGWVIAYALGGAALTVIGPFGLAVFTAPFRVRGFDHSITEWAPTSLKLVVTLVPAFGIGALVAVVVIWVGLRDRKLPLYELGLVAGSLALAFGGIRLIPVFGLLGIPVVVRRLAPAMDKARSAPLLCSVLALALAPSVALIPGIQLGRGFDDANLPTHATNWLAAHGVAGRPFHFLPFGGEVALRLHDEGTRVFIDGRTAWLYPRPFFDAYERAEHDLAAFDALDAEYQFDWALVRARPSEHFSEPLAGHRQFRMVYLDDCAAIYVRTNGAMASLIPAAYQAIHHLTPAAALLAAPPPPSLLDHDAQLALTQAPTSPRAHFLDAAAARATHDQNRLVQARAWLQLHAPDDSYSVLVGN